MQFLPGFYHESDFLRRYLLILESLWETAETRQDFLPFFDPRTCPPGFLSFLANWLGLKLPESHNLPEANRRDLIAFAFGNLPEPSSPNRTPLTPRSSDGIPQTEGAGRQERSLFMAGCGGGEP